MQSCFCLHVMMNDVSGPIRRTGTWRTGSFCLDTEGRWREDRRRRGRSTSCSTTRWGGGGGGGGVIFFIIIMWPDWTSLLLFQQIRWKNWASNVSFADFYFESKKTLSCMKGWDSFLSAHTAQRAFLMGGAYVIAVSSLCHRWKIPQSIFFT